MRDATIATSRTRASDTPDPIDYRPAPQEWGDTEALYRLRVAKARAAEQGLDPSVLEIATEPTAGSPCPVGRSARRRMPVARHRRQPLWRTPFSFAS